MNVAENILQLIGNTPLVELKKMEKETNARIFAKLEFFNPMGSVKDRIALSMIEDAERRGILRKGMCIVEPTSGNTGIGIAMVCAVKGYRAVIVMPENMSLERRKILKALGAEIILTPAEEGMMGAIKRAEEIVNKNKNCIMLQQFKNPANPEIHRRTTAMEIWRDMEGRVDVFVAGVGSGGTITGIGEVLKKFKEDVKVVAIEPEKSAVLSGGKPGKHGIQGIGAGFVPDVLNMDVVDEVIKVSDEDAAKMMFRLAREEGIFAGISAGAAVYGAMEIAKREESKGKNIVIILPDTGERYLSSWVFEGI